MRFGLVLALVSAGIVANSPMSRAASSLFGERELIPSHEDLVPPSEAGQFLVEPVGPDELRLTVKGRTFTSKPAAEKYLAYRAAEATLEQRKTWFTVDGPQHGSDGVVRSFRLENWRPAWRYKLSGAPEWKSWAPGSAEPFFADGKDPKLITEFELTAVIKLRSGKPNTRDPLAFEAEPLAHTLAPQVSPPQ